MTSQNGKQIITIHILANISRSKGNQAIRFGHLIEYNMVRMSLEKSYTKTGGESSSLTSPIQFALVGCPSGGLLKCIKTKVMTASFTSYKAF